MKKVIIVSIALFLSTISFGQIVYQPKSDTACSGDFTFFKTTVAYPNPSYQWQKWNGTIWVNLTNVSPFSGVMDSILVLNPVTDTLNNSFFRCKIDTNAVFFKNSDSAVLTVL
ncbi:MAG: hypothetical protein ACKVQB_04640, partial [Bacteroidia bacterium]